ncbi:MAG TPA: outer membrane lipoprotein carrier protein LolA [Candidatus Hydrogenedentes bacterium]|nr:outer membrane lipoprotein carrier protein LolA [Candidatus Hydrogenedentota bacterium]
MTRTGSWKAWVIFLGITFPVVCGASDPKAILLRIEQKMSEVKTIEADFTQEKILAAFKRPLLSKGKIFIQKPLLFSWRVDAPVRYCMVIKEDSLKQWDEETKQVQHISLTDKPGFSDVIAQIKIWFSGEYSSLVKEYAVKVLSEEPAQLEFSPNASSPAAEVIKTVRVAFESDERYLREIYIEEKGGDKTTITFSSAKLNTAIDPSAWEVKPDAK